MKVAKIDRTAEEAYRVLRTNISFGESAQAPASATAAAAGEPEGDRKIRTLAVTSCLADEGKSTTALNLAVSMAKSGLKVLLMDADLRKPKKAKKGESESRVGLTNLITGHIPMSDAIEATDVENLSVMHSGYMPLNPAEMVGSEIFRGILATLERVYDMIIIDTPPIGSVIDGAVIAAQTDGTIMVVKYGKVRETGARRAKEQLVKVNARLLGVVLNMMKKHEYRHYYEYYRYVNK